VGKFVGYFVIVVVILFLLEWFQIVDIPFIDLQDYLSNKEVMVDKTQNALEQLK
jgi:hypothetical protein